MSSGSSCRREEVWRQLHYSGSGLLQAKSYPCGFCEREFRSAQALGGHMNVHRRDRARARARLRLTQQAVSPPPPKPPAPAPPLLPNLNYPPPHDQIASSSSPAAALNLELGRPPAVGATEEDDGRLDLELRLAFC